MVTWNQTQINISTPLPQIPATVTMVTPYTFRYYYNVCTFGYTTVWCVGCGCAGKFQPTSIRWQWERWQRELDWAAMNGTRRENAYLREEISDEQTGVNLPLAMVGQEAVWQQGSLSRASERF
jgi:alpha-N-acetylglucosaminidase